MEIRFSYKYGTIYCEVLHSPRFDWCSLMKKGKSDNLLVRALLQHMKENAAVENFHECPYTVSFDDFSDFGVEVGLFRC